MSFRPTLIRAGLVLLGAYVGLAGAFVHRHGVDLLGVAWPWGLVVALFATAAVATAVGPWCRVGEAWFALGWGLVLILQPWSPDGSYLVADDWLGWTYSFGGVGALGLVVVRGSRVER